jgi:hypothetical protein
MRAGAGWSGIMTIIDDAMATAGYHCRTSFRPLPVTVHPRLHLVELLGSFDQ